jgi:hypothetical protein
VLVLHLRESATLPDEKRGSRDQCGAEHLHGIT